MYEYTLQLSAREGVVCIVIILGLIALFKWAYKVVGSDSAEKTTNNGGWSGKSIALCAEVLDFPYIHKYVHIHTNTVKYSTHLSMYNNCTIASTQSRVRQNQAPPSSRHHVLIIATHCCNIYDVKSVRRRGHICTTVLRSPMIWLNAAVSNRQRLCAHKIALCADMRTIKCLHLFFFCIRFFSELRTLHYNNASQNAWQCTSFASGLKCSCVWRQQYIEHLLCALVYSLWIAE